MNEEMCKIEVVIEERKQDFIQSASKYYVNPEIVLEWCENLETHLLNSKWEKIPNKDVKRMLVSCITGAARKED